MTPRNPMPSAWREQVYGALMAYGHSPAKAAEIVLDAKRGDPFSVQYVEFILKRTPA